MIKILFAVNNLNVGGAERLVLNQLRFLDRKEFDGWLITLLPDARKNFNSEAFFLEDKWKKFSFKSIFDIFSFYRLCLFLRKEKFDVVITNLFFTNLIVRFAVIFSGHSLVISTEQNVYRQKKYWQIIADKFLARFTYKIIAVSKDVAEFTSKQENIPLEKFVINYNAISFEDIRQNKEQQEIVKLKKSLEIKSEDCVVSTVGRLTEQKGQVYLIEAIKILKDKYPDFKIKVFIFGDGELRAFLEKKVSDYSLNSNVFLPGVWLIKDIMAITDIFAFPSLWEGLSLVLLEAMAAAKPIIAARVSGTNELICDGQNGLLVEPKDVNGLAQKIYELSKNKKLMNSLEQEAQKTSRRFSIENNLDILKNIIIEGLKVGK